MMVQIGFFLLFLLVPSRGEPHHASAAAIIKSSQSKVRATDRRTDSLSGTLHLRVSFSSDVIGKRTDAESVYLVTFVGGKDTSIRPIGQMKSSDSTASVMMLREARSRMDKPALRIFDAAFPWERILAGSKKKYLFTSNVASDSAKLSGRICYLIRFHLDAEGDSLDAEGSGRIWIDRSSLLPVRTSDDLTLSTPRGKAEVRAFSDFRVLPEGIPVLVKSEIRTIPKFLFVNVGLIKIIIEQTDFNLE